MYRRAQILLISIAVGMGALAVVTSLIFGHSLVDPAPGSGPTGPGRGWSSW